MASLPAGSYRLVLHGLDSATGGIETPDVAQYAFTLQREEEFKTLLGVPPGKRLLTLVPLGVPVEWPVKEKKPLASVVFWERYPRSDWPAAQGDATP